MVNMKRLPTPKQTLVNELHKPARKNFKRRRVVMKAIDDSWQCDLVQMDAYAAQNNGYSYLLTVIDTFSKYAWAIPIRRKTGEDVTEAMSTIFKEGRIPKNMQSDDGTDFFNKHFKRLMLQHKINHYSTFSSLKASIVERLNKTLKHIMWKEFSMNGNYKWIGMIKKLVATYNTNYHQTIKMKPINVNSSHEQHLLSTVYNHIKVAGFAKYKIGDTVRISKYKHIFEKGYTPNWTTEIFTISKVQITNPVTYLLQDYQNRPIAGSFYELELQKIPPTDLYLVEEVLKKKADKVFVKWLGFSSEHNSWIDSTEVL